MFVSDDAGATWRRTNDSRDLRQRAFYYTHVYADPKIKDRVYVTNVQFFRSDDGGKTFPTKLRPPHGDNHDLWIAPNDNQRMIESNDGGASVSVTGGKTLDEGRLSDRPDLPRHHHQPLPVPRLRRAAGQHDDLRAQQGLEAHEHARRSGASRSAAARAAISPTIRSTRTSIMPAATAASSTDSIIRTGQSRAINVVPDNPMGYSAIDIPERFQWTYPIVFDPQDKTALYVSSQHVFRSTNGGQSWDRISPDLTRADPATLAASGGPITLDQTGVETYGTVFALDSVTAREGRDLDRLRRRACPHHAR